MATTPHFLTVAEAAELTRLKPQTLYRMSCERRIPCTKAGAKLLFREDRLLQWLDSRSREPLAPATPARRRTA